MTSELERVTVNLVPKSSDALAVAMELGRDTKSDTINKAIQAYAYLLEARRDGGVYVRDNARGGELFRLEFL